MAELMGVDAISWRYLRLVEWSQQLKVYFDIADGENCDHIHHPKGEEPEDDLHSISLESCGDAEYDGPFDGVAVALTDSQHSPYDRHALRYKVILENKNQI